MHGSEILMSNFEFHRKEPEQEHVGVHVAGCFYHWTRASEDAPPLPVMAAAIKKLRPSAQVWYTRDGETNVYMSLAREE